MGIKKTLFDQILDDCNAIIEKSKDKNIKRKQKELQDSYQKIVNSNSPECQEFYSVVHELKTYEAMNNLNLKPLANNDCKKGPDYLTNLGYIECVTFSKPTDDNSINILSGSVNRYCAFEPRITQALNEKKDKFNNYIASNTIDKSKAKIICINPGECGFDINSTTFYEAVQKALFGIGCLCIQIDLKKDEVVGTCRNYEDQITKPKNNSLISIDYFNQKAYEDISGVMLINNLPYEKFNLIYLFINPNAKIKIDKRKTRKILIFEQKGKDAFYTHLNGKNMSFNNYNKMRENEIEKLTKQQNI